MSSMMGSVETLAMAGGGGSPGSLRAERKCWNNFKSISGDAAGGAEAGPGS